MASSTSPSSELIDQACAMIEEMGGARSLLDDLTEFRQLRIRMSEEHSGLFEQYPDRWVAVGFDGLVAVGDSEDEVFEKIDDKGISRSHVVVEYLDTDPPVLIL